jgi:hypothetical protein
MSVTATAPEIAITVFDGRDQKVHAAVGSTSVALPPGLYRVRSELHGQMAEVLVAHAGTSQVEARMPAEYSVTPIHRAVTSRRHHHGEVAAALSLTDTARRPDPEGAAKTSRIFVFVRRAGSLKRPIAADLAAGLELVNSKGEVVTAFGADDTVGSDTDGYLALSAPVDHGYYVLRFQGATPREVAMYAYRGYSTQIFLLNHAHAHTHTQLRFDGIDFLIAALGEPFQPSDPVAHASTAGRWILQNRRGEPPPALAEVLRGGSFRAPMLGLLGAHLLLRSKAFDARIAGGVMARLEELLGDVEDVQALRVLAALRSGSPIPQVNIAHPPMLRPGLEALVEASRTALDLIQPDSDIERAAVGLYVDCPFSSWAPRGAAGQAHAGAEDGAADWLDSTVLAVAKETARSGRSLDVVTLSRELAVPLITLQAALSRARVVVPEEAEARPAFALKVTDGPMKGDVFVFRTNDTCVVGRDVPRKEALSALQLKLPLEDVKASRAHFLLKVSPGGAKICDLGSFNGTYVNDVRYGENQEVSVMPGDRIRAGETVFECTVELPPPAGGRSQ